VSRFLESWLTLHREICTKVTFWTN